MNQALREAKHEIAKASMNQALKQQSMKSSRHS
jgi:hypothetical protein